VINIPVTEVESISVLGVSRRALVSNWRQLVLSRYFNNYTLRLRAEHFHR
jgi:hypothetical protein